MAYIWQPALEFDNVNLLFDIWHQMMLGKAAGLVKNQTFRLTRWKSKRRKLHLNFRWPKLFLSSFDPVKIPVKIPQDMFMFNPVRIWNWTRRRVTDIYNSFCQLNFTPLPFLSNNRKKNRKKLRILYFFLFTRGNSHCFRSIVLWLLTPRFNRQNMSKNYGLNLSTVPYMHPLIRSSRRTNNEEVNDKTLKILHWFLNPYFLLI